MTSPTAGAADGSQRESLAPHWADTRDLARVAELESLNILDTEAEASFDDITQLAATLFGTPVALISFVDAKRQWFKSRVGLDATETPREGGFCSHALEAPGQVMVVPDASQDARFAGNALVTGDPHIRFYAGAPLVTSRGHALGTLCVIGNEPRLANPAHLAALELLAKQVVQLMENRREVGCTKR